MAAVVAVTLLGSTACAGDAARPPAGPVVLTGVTIVTPAGRSAADQQIRIEGTRIVEVGASVALEGAEVRAPRGRFVTSAFVDSHVHLAYLDEPRGMAQGGIAAVVDWASPVEWLAEASAGPAGLSVVASGPMITATAGYPTQSWGRNGYGAECDSVEACVAAVERHRAAGAKVVKIPITTGPQLPDAVIEAVVAHAHAHDMLVGVHALSDEQAGRAAALGADILVHVPTGAVSDATVAAWSDKTLIPTLAAFGSSPTAIDNLRRMREAGTRIVYGTDFGNSRTAGIQPAELEAMQAAGLDGAAVLQSGTAAPAALFGFDLGIAPGQAASLLVLDADPLVEPAVLGRPVEVWVAGVPQ